MFKIENISKKFDNGVEPIHDLSAVIHQGDVISLIGPSGTGKSTIIGKIIGNEQLKLEFSISATTK